MTLHEIWWDYVTSTTVQKHFIGAMFYVHYFELKVWFWPNFLKLQSFELHQRQWVGCGGLAYFALST